MPASSAPGMGGGGGGGDAMPMRPTQLLHLVKAALSAKALADVANARSGGDAGLRMPEFLPRFFAYRFGSGNAARQAAAFRAGLLAYSGTSPELQSFACILAGSNSSEVASPPNGASPIAALPDDVDGPDASTRDPDGEQRSADTVSRPVRSLSEAPPWSLPPLIAVSDTAPLLHETAGQLACDLLATPGAEALLKAVARPAFMCSALASVDLGLRIRSA